MIRPSSSPLQFRLGLLTLPPLFQSIHADVRAMMLCVHAVTARRVPRKLYGRFGKAIRSSSSGTDTSPNPNVVGSTHPTVNAGGAAVVELHAGRGKGSSGSGGSNGGGGGDDDDGAISSDAHVHVEAHAQTPVPTTTSYLLFPGGNVLGSAADVELARAGRLQLVAVDATWQYAREMVAGCPLLSSLPRRMLPPRDPATSQPPVYIGRKQPDAGVECTSTYEAVIDALMAVEASTLEQHRATLMQPLHTFADQQFKFLKDAGGGKHRPERPGYDPTLLANPPAANGAGSAMDGGNDGGDGDDGMISSNGTGSDGSSGGSSGGNSGGGSGVGTEARGGGAATSPAAAIAAAAAAANPTLPPPVESASSGPSKAVRWALRSRRRGQTITCQKIRVVKAALEEATAADADGPFLDPHWLLACPHANIALLLNNAVILHLLLFMYSFLQ